MNHRIDVYPKTKIYSFIKSSNFFSSFSPLWIVFYFYCSMPGHWTYPAYVSAENYYFWNCCRNARRRNASKSETTLDFKFEMQTNWELISSFICNAARYRTLLKRYFVHFSEPHFFLPNTQQKWISFEFCNMIVDAKLIFIYVKEIEVWTMARGMLSCWLQATCTYPFLTHFRTNMSNEYLEFGN